MTGCPGERIDLERSITLIALYACLNLEAGKSMLGMHGI